MLSSRLAWFLQQVDHALEVAQRGLESARVCSHQAGQLRGKRLVPTSSSWTASRRATAREQHVAVGDQLHELLVAVGEHGGHGARSGEQLAELGVAARRRSRESRDRPSSVPWNAAGRVLASGRPACRARRRAARCRSARPRSASPVTASTTSNGDAVRSSGIVASSSSWPGPSGSSARYFCAEHGLDPDRRAGLGAEPRRLVDPERHVARWSPRQLDVGDLADPDAGDAHLVAGAEPAGVAERGAVGVAAADQRQIVDLERDDEQRERARRG